MWKYYQNIYIQHNITLRVFRRWCVESSLLAFVGWYPVAPELFWELWWGQWRQFFEGCRDCWRVLGEVTDVHVLDIVVGIDLENFFYKFCDGGRFLKLMKTWERVVICWYSRGFSRYESHLYFDGNYQVTPQIFFFRDGMNNPLCLENPFWNIGRVLSVFYEDKIQEKIGSILLQNANKINLTV